MTTPIARDRRESLTRGLLWCGAAAGPAFVSVFLLEGARRPDYQPRRHPVSSLSLGPRGWVQRANFGLSGLLYVAGAAGLSRAADPIAGTWLDPVIVGAAGLGLLGSAVFSTDPVSGYPPGTPDVGVQNSASMRMHGIAAVPIFLGLPCAAFAYACRFRRRGRPAWALYCAGTGASMLANMGLAGAGFNQSPGLVNTAGLFQRAAIVSGFGWLTTLTAHALRGRTPPRDNRSAT
jgi:hypothetical protein